MNKTPTTQTKPKSSSRAVATQKALVVGVSGYPAPIPKLPAVAADVREMAKLLASKNGAFPLEGVQVLTEKQAVRHAVLAALKAVFTGARAKDTLFIYLAGHGGIEGEDYYFVPYDAKGKSLAEGGVPLAEIKRLFDRTASRRVFLWLDFCHSGGILARGNKTDDLPAIRRSIGVVSGQGKVILAACTPAQSAYEDPKVGHGLFTDALLRGLKGEARSAQGDVTALSLYDFINNQVTHPLQRPTFFGHMEGSLVLMHYPDRAGAPKSKPPEPTPAKPSTKAAPVARITTSGDLLLLDGRVYTSRFMREQNGGSVVIEVVPKNAEEEAALRGLRTGQSMRHKEVKFAFRNLGFTGQVGEVSSLTSGAKPAWSITLKPAEAGGHMVDFGYNGLSVEELTDMRARLLLLGVQPEGQGSGSDTMLLHFVQGRLKELGLSEAVFTALGKQERARSTEFLRRARLWAVYYLMAGGICDEVLELRLGPIRAGKLGVKYRGRRKSRYTNGEPHEINVEGECLLKQ